jgi:KUP system potassium uptake protein
MEAAYGLSIIITMIMTTILLVNYLFMKHYRTWLICILLVVYLFIEFSFLAANLSKFHHGGWITLLIATVIICVMFTWFSARKIMNKYVEFVSLKDHIPLIKELSDDITIEKYATNLVYLTSADDHNEIEEKIIYSLLRKRPKRADVYWFVHVDVTDEPHTREYTVEQIIPYRMFRLDIRLGFREVPAINKYFREIVADMQTHGEVDILSRYQSLYKNHITGDFRFVVMKKYLAADNELPLFQNLIMNGYFLLKKVSLSEEKAFGLDTSNVKIELVPVLITTPKEPDLRRIR